MLTGEHRPPQGELLDEVPQGDLFDETAELDEATEPTPAEVLAAAGITVTETMTTPTRPGKKPRPVWEVRGHLVGLTEAMREGGGRKWRGAWSFWEDPTDWLADDVTAGRAGYADELEAKRERAEERAERREDWAAKAEARSEAGFAAARGIPDGIPFGQPILVGHHSERRHRRDLDRIDSGMRRGCEEADKAAYHRRRAEAAEAEASGDHTRGFCQNRIDDAEKELRDLDRKLTGKVARTRYTMDRPDGKPAEGVYRERLLDAKAYQEGKRDYWKAELAKHGPCYSRETVAKGDLVRVRGWRTVVRANPKTVTVAAPEFYEGATLKYKWAQVTGHKPAGEES